MNKTSAKFENNLYSFNIASLIFKTLFSKFKRSQMTKKEKAKAYKQIIKDI